MKSILKPAFLAFALCALSAHAQSPNLNEIAPYKPSTALLEACASPAAN